MADQPPFPTTWTHTHDPFRSFYGERIAEEELAAAMADTADTPKTILIVAGHPDDGDAGCGGSAAKWAAQGHRVILCVATNGNKGSGDPTMDSARLEAIRDREQRAAAKVMGIREVVILPNKDGELADTYEFRGQLVRLIRRYRPDRIVTHNPYRWQHRDHRITGQGVLDAVWPYCRDRLHYPELAQEGLTPHKVPEVYLFAGFDGADADVEEDITDFWETKLNALACHVSQFGPPEEMRQRWLARRQERQGEENGRMLERFKRVEYPV
ncbi:MAG: PIG-L family deacetylase [Chloroflexi bacterium]|nr:PIG-L family deacetylase [Chloroflexota bacterium]